MGGSTGLAYRTGVKPIDFIVVGVRNDSLDPVESLRLGNGVALGKGIEKWLESLLPLSCSTVVETFDSRLTLVVVANAEVDLTGLNILHVLLDSLKTGNGGILGPSQRDTKLGEGLRCLESARLPRSNNTEVRTSSLDTPEEVGILRGRSGLDGTISQDDVNALDGIQGKTVHVGAETIASVSEVTRNANTTVC